MRLHMMALNVWSGGCVPGNLLMEVDAAVCALRSPTYHRDVVYASLGENSEIQCSCRRFASTGRRLCHRCFCRRRYVRHRCSYRDIRLQLHFGKENVCLVFPSFLLPGWIDEVPVEVGEEEQGNRPSLTERDHTSKCVDGKVVEFTRVPEDRHYLSSYSERGLMMEHDLRENCLCMFCLSERWPQISKMACHVCENVMVGGCCWWNNLRPVETGGPNDNIICVAVENMQRKDLIARLWFLW